MSDPQQRLAKMFDNQSTSKDGNNANYSSNKSYLSQDNNNIDMIEATNKNKTLFAENQTLQNKIVELQLELKATRIDRDGLSVELQNARDNLLALHHSSSSNSSSINNMSMMDVTGGGPTPKGGEKNSGFERDTIKNLKEIIQRKGYTAIILIFIVFKYHSTHTY